MGGGGTPSTGMIGVAGVAAGAAIGGAILSIGSSLASKGAELGQRMFEGASMRQDIMAGFSALLGGTSQASAAFEQIKAKAAQIGAPLLDTAKQVQGLLAGGFQLGGDTGAMRVLEATRALKFINPSANVDNVVMALAQIQSKGKLMAEELHGQLGDAGINIGRVYEALATKLGKKTDDIRRMMQKGSISAADGIAAVFQSIEKTGGKSLSELASAGTKNFSSLLERAKALPEELGARMQLGGAINTLSGSLGKIIDRAGKLDLSHVFETVAKTIDRLVNIGTKVDLVPMLEKASGAVDRLVAAAEKAHLGELISAWSDAVAGEAFSGFADGFLEVAQFAKALSPDEIRDTAKSFAAIGKVLGGVAAGLIVIATWGPKINPVIRGVKARRRPSP
jgi:tape measure domain-containing protein